jgi:O-acetyl-ADP-ribose deacetylase (regulator of RNase III)
MKRIELLQGDITTLSVDAIVNAANSSLTGGGGVDGAIHRAGGPKILEECMLIRNSKGGCPAGEAVVTSGGNLKARYVIHTVGPEWTGGNKNEDQLLSNAYRNCLRVAVDHQVRSVAFPNISTGVYGFPKDRAAGIAVESVNDFLSGDDTLERVIFCCFDRGNYEIYSTLLK